MALIVAVVIRGAYEESNGAVTDEESSTYRLIYWFILNIAQYIQVEIYSAIK